MASSQMNNEGKNINRPQWRNALYRLVEPHPSIQEIGARRQAELLAGLTMALFILTVTGMFASAAVNGWANSSVWIFSGLNLVLILVYILSRSPLFRVGATLSVVALSILPYITLIFAYQPDNPPADTLFTYLSIAYVLGSILLSLRGLMMLVVLNIIAMFLVPYVNPQLLGSDIFTAMGAISTTGVLLILGVVVRNAVERGRLAELRTANEELDAIRASLEQRVIERTRLLETSAEVSRRLSTILDPQQLVKEVVDEVQRAFGYYHAHIYLLDERDEVLRMVGGTGEAGRIMLESGHRIAIGKGLVGRTAQIKQAVLVSDTLADSGWLPNPLLPETGSEVAVPIMIGERVLGVLDVQQNRVNGLSSQDSELLQSIANQLAIALQNAHQIESAQQLTARSVRSDLIIRQIQETHTVKEALQVAVRELGRMLDIPKAQVSLDAKRFSSGRKSGEGTDASHEICPA